MGILQAVESWSETTIVDLIKDATSASGNQFDVIQAVKNDRTVVIAVLSGDQASSIFEAMQNAKHQLL
jgi:hypothetical protein